MTSPLVPSYAEGAKAYLDRLRTRFAPRASVMQTVARVRSGEIKQLFSAELGWDDEFQGVPIANFIDIVARDLTEGIAPLPSLNCTSGQMKHQTDRARAERKNHVGGSYWRYSKLQKFMYSIADQFVSTGFASIYVEPDVDEQCPRIRYEESTHTYYDLDREGDTVVWGHWEHASIDELIAQFGDSVPTDAILRKAGAKDADSGQTLLEVVKWIDKKRVTLFLPERDGLILTSYEHRLSRHPVRVVERPGFSRKAPRGQFDDVVWVQVARAIMGLLALKATAKAVNAPTALPSDVDELPIGPDSVIISDNADKIHTVQLGVDPKIFAENQTLDNELRVGSRYPDARTGELQASVITGKGVEALLGTFDSQIRGDQMVFAEALEEITSMCFEMDEVWWPNVEKTVRGTTVAGSYEFTYRPKTEINGRWECSVTYGFMTGLKPAQAIVSALQLAGAGLVAKKTAVTNLPFDIDAEQESQAVNTEAAREALKQGLFALVQSSGQIASQGGDALSIIKLGVDAIKGIEDGKSVEDAIQQAYETMQQEQQQKAAEAAQQQQQAGGPGAPGAGGPGGLTDSLPPDVAPGQAGLPPGGLATIENLTAGFRGNGSLPISQATISRRVGTGT